MTEQELREKIVKIALNTSWTDMFGDHYSIGESAANAIADALIAAGIGDVKETEAEANRYEMLYKLQNRDMALAERRAHDAEHRAEVAERALKKACFILARNYYTDGGDWGRFRDEFVAHYKEQAEKELAEEGEK